MLLVARFDSLGKLLRLLEHFLLSAGDIVPVKADRRRFLLNLGRSHKRGKLTRDAEHRLAPLFLSL